MGSAQPQGHQTDSLSFFAGDDQGDQEFEADVHRHRRHFQGQPAMFQFTPSAPPSPQHTLGTRISVPPQPQPPAQSQSRSQQIMPVMDMLGDLMHMSFQGLDSNSSQTSSSPSIPTGGPAMAYHPQQLLLEHQFRLSQLQQLQQLQHQIFQQQVCAGR